jgi:hypothetical protein
LPAQLRPTLPADAAAAAATPPADVSVAGASPDATTDTAPPLRKRLEAATVAPDSFSDSQFKYDQGGDWSTIKSEDPFEVLYFDCAHWKRITPSIVEQRFTTLSDHWQLKIRQMNTGAARQQIADRYGGEALIRSFPKRLEEARRQLETSEGIAATFARLEQQRIAKGQAHLLEKLEPSLVAGFVEAPSLARVASDALVAGLQATEAAEFLVHTLKARGLRPTEGAVGESLGDLVAVRWSTESCDRLDEIRSNDPHDLLSLREYSPFGNVRRTDLTAAKVNAAFEAKARWWRAQEATVAAGSSRATRDNVLTRLETARARLLADLQRSAQSAASPAASPAVTPAAVPSPAGKSRQGTGTEAPGQGAGRRTSWMVRAVVLVILLATVSFVLNRPARPPELSAVPPGRDMITVAPAVATPQSVPRSGESGVPTAEAVPSPGTNRQETTRGAVASTPSAPLPPVAVVIPQTPEQQVDSLLQEASTFFGADSPGRAYGIVQRVTGIIKQTEREAGPSQAMSNRLVRAERLIALALQLCDKKENPNANYTGCP